MRLIAIALLASGISTSALAAPETHSHSHAEAAPSSGETTAKPRKICKQAEASSTGRIGSAKVCKTAEEWAKHDEKTGSSRSVRTIKRD